MFLGTDTKVTGRLIGECVTHDVVRIVVESVEVSIETVGKNGFSNMVFVSSGASAIFTNRELMYGEIF